MALNKPEERRFLRFENSLPQHLVIYPRPFTLILLYLFGGNTVLPLIDIPLLGLSLSALPFFLITLETVFRLKYLFLKSQLRWAILAYAIALGMLLSIAANEVLGNLQFESNMIVALVQAVYWLLVFCVTAAMVSHLNRRDINRLVVIIGISIVALGGLRMVEAIVFNRVGPSTSRIFPQNAYGILFSSFTPFATLLIFRARSFASRGGAFLGVTIIVFAIVINGSRSSWLATAVGLAVLGGLYVIVKRRTFFSLAGLVVITILSGIMLISILPSEVLSPIAERFATLENLDEDKSYATRELMQQKSLNLFEANPLFGIGRNQFRKVSVQLDFTGTPFSSSRNADFNEIASHNSYAQWLAESGLAGTVPFLLLLLWLLKDGVFAAIKIGRRGDLWALAIVAAFIAMSIHLWSIDNLKTSGAWFVYGLMAGMIGYEHYSRPRTDDGHMTRH